MCWRLLYVSRLDPLEGERHQKLRTQMVQTGPQQFGPNLIMGRMQGASGHWPWPRNPTTAFTRRQNWADASEALAIVRAVRGRNGRPCSI
jgi:hypothetical protein